MIDALLNNTKKTFKIKDKEYISNKFKVRDYKDLKDILFKIGLVLNEFKDDPDLQALSLLTDAFAETCTLIVVSTNMTTEEVLDLDKEEFMTAIVNVIESNTDFFVLAAKSAAYRMNQD